MTKTIRTSTGHTMAVNPITSDEFDLALPNSQVGCSYKQFYKVCNWDANGAVFFYMAKGYQRDDGLTAPSEYHVWYPRSQSMWGGFGKNQIDAINGAIRDGWLYA